MTMLVYLRIWFKLGFMKRLAILFISTLCYQACMFLHSQNLHESGSQNCHRKCLHSHTLTKAPSSKPALAKCYFHSGNTDRSARCWFSVHIIQLQRPLFLKKILYTFSLIKQQIAACLKHNKVIFKHFHTRCGFTMKWSHLETTYE